MTTIDHYVSSPKYRAVAHLSIFSRAPEADKSNIQTNHRPITVVRAQCVFRCSIDEPYALSIASCNPIPSPCQGRQPDDCANCPYQIHPQSTIPSEESKYPSVPSDPIVHLSPNVCAISPFHPSESKKVFPTHPVASCRPCRVQQLSRPLCQHVASIKFTSLLWRSLRTGWLLSKACLTSNAGSGLGSLLLRLLYLILALLYHEVAGIETKPGVIFSRRVSRKRELASIENAK